MVFFTNTKNWQIGNWQIATDIFIAIIRAKSQGFNIFITRNICDILKLRNKFINIYFVIVYQWK